MSLEATLSADDRSAAATFTCHYHRLVSNLPKPDVANTGVGMISSSASSIAPSVTSLQLWYRYGAILLLFHRICDVYKWCLSCQMCRVC